MWPAFRQPGTNRHLLGLFLLASAAIPLFYVAGLMWHRHTQPGDGRVLALVGGAPVGRRVLRGLRHGGDRLPVHPDGPAARPSTATAAVLFSTTIFLSGGIIGTFHHLYFTGTPTVVLALGSVVQRAGGRAAGADRVRGATRT